MYNTYVCAYTKKRNKLKHISVLKSHHRHYPINFVLCTSNYIKNAYIHAQIEKWDVERP